MNLEEAKNLLGTCKVTELRDDSIGDSEVVWTKDGETIADGYFGSSRYVSVPHDGTHTTFTDEEAHQLRKCGNNLSVSFNHTPGDGSLADTRWQAAQAAAEDHDDYVDLAYSYEDEFY